MAKLNLTEEAAVDSLLKFKPDSEEEAVELDRLFLRFFENPGLIASLKSIGKNASGQCEVVFSSVPEDLVPLIKQTIGLDSIEAVKFDIHGQPHLGFRFDAKEFCKSKK